MVRVLLGVVLLTLGGCQGTLLPEDLVCSSDAWCPDGFHCVAPEGGGSCVADVAVEEACDDGADNDGDAAVDCADPDCAEAAACAGDDDDSSVGDDDSGDDDFVGDDDSGDDDSGDDDSVGDDDSGDDDSVGDDDSGRRRLCG